jgi:hypothetical protein
LTAPAIAISSSAAAETIISSTAPVQIPPEVAATSAPASARPSPPVTAPQAAPPIVEAPAPAPKPKSTTPEEFERWLTDAPYGHEAKALLKLISAKAPAFLRSRILGNIVARMPQVVFDPDRCGSNLYSRIIEEPGRPATISLNTGVILYEQRQGLFGSTLTLLPQSAKLFSDSGAAPLTLQAFARDSAPKKEEIGPWGRTAVYEDGSRRALFSPEQQAGQLLADLTRLDARWRGWDDSPAVVEQVARLAQWLFYEALLRERREGDFLDLEMRRSFRLWKDRPGEYADYMAQALIAGAAPGQHAESAGAPLSAAALDEALEAEKRFRQEQANARKE